MDILFSFLIFAFIFTFILGVTNNGNPLKYSTIVAKNEGFFHFFVSLFYAIFVLKDKYIKVSLISYPSEYIDSKSYGLVEMACRKALNGDTYSVRPGEDSVKFQHHGKDLVLTFNSIHCTFNHKTSVIIPPRLVLLIEAAVKHMTVEKVEKKNVFEL